MDKANLKEYRFEELGVSIELETQSVKGRLRMLDSDDVIGTVDLESVGVGQVIVKNLYIDTTKRHEFKNIHDAIVRALADVGWEERLHQRFKRGEFVTQSKQIKK